MESVNQGAVCYCTATITGAEHLSWTLLVQLPLAQGHPEVPTVEQDAVNNRITINKVRIQLL